VRRHPGHRAESTREVRTREATPASYVCYGSSRGSGEAKVVEHVEQRTTTEHDRLGRCGEEAAGEVTSQRTHEIRDVRCLAFDHRCEETHGDLANDVVADARLRVEGDASHSRSLLQERRTEMDVQARRAGRPRDVVPRPRWVHADVA
jgi:hypothetical protein